MRTVAELKPARALAARMCSRSLSAAAVVASGSLPDPIATVSPIASVVMRIALSFPPQSLVATPSRTRPWGARAAIRHCWLPPIMIGGGARENSMP
ncbi:hypothetical protein KYK30_12680 [Shinella yambaruensis]|uniref:hypothetical protein n=1 Tax=Shinella yambaruensis TaxID=415996 RepID=UPI001FD34BD5|nr:hypothetical protein [Shinella yambaruensis]MCJ8029866.1 hypothetical protein [Shinella yambaruensis]MCU7980554.1 hypothetical protein [Shinella yambaruensis]